MEYISREAALDRFTYEHGELIPEVGDHGEETEIWVRDVKAVLRSLPAADVAPVVRCRECVHWGRSEEIMPDGKKADYGWCGKLLDADSETEITTSEKDFCSYGERR